MATLNNVDIIQSIRNYERQPITHQLLMVLLRDYKRPNDKVHALLKDGVLLAYNEVST